MKGKNIVDELSYLTWFFFVDDDDEADEDDVDEVTDVFGAEIVEVDANAVIGTKLDAIVVFKCVVVVALVQSGVQQILSHTC